MPVIYGCNDEETEQVPVSGSWSCLVIKLCLELKSSELPVVYVCVTYCLSTINTAELAANQTNTVNSPFFIFTLFSFCFSGIALLYLHLYDVFGDPAYLQMAHGYVKQSLNSLSKRSITFLCGDAGPLAVGAVVYHKMNNEKQAEDCITR